MAQIDINVDYYLDEASTNALLKEITKRRERINSEDVSEIVDIFDFLNLSKLDKIRQVLGLRLKISTKEQIINEINDL